MGGISVLLISLFFLSLTLIKIIFVQIFLSVLFHPKWIPEPLTDLILIFLSISVSIVRDAVADQKPLRLSLFSFFSHFVFIVEAFKKNYPQNNKKTKKNKVDYVAHTDWQSKGNHFPCRQPA